MCCNSCWKNIGRLSGGGEFGVDDNDDSCGEEDGRDDYDDGG